MDYQIKPVEIDGSTADGVYKNEYGAWLGIIDWQHDDYGEGTQIVLPLVDESSDFVPAPDNWRDLIIKQLNQD